MQEVFQNLLLNKKIYTLEVTWGANFSFLFFLQGVEMKEERVFIVLSCCGQCQGNMFPIEIFRSLGDLFYLSYPIPYSYNH